MSLSNINIAINIFNFFLYITKSLVLKILTVENSIFWRFRTNKNLALKTVLSQT